MAPEVIEMKTPTPKSDIWSVGCVCLEILTGKPPYYNLTPMSALFHICSDAEVPIDDPSHIITPECLSFIKECFVRDPEKRKSAADLLEHPWFKVHGVRNQHHFSMDKTPSVKPPSLASRLFSSFSSLPAHSTINETPVKPIQTSNSLPLSLSADDLNIDISEDDINKLIDETEKTNFTIPRAALPSATNKAQSSTVRSWQDSSSSDNRGSDKLQVESELIERIQIIAGASSGESKEPSDVVLVALQKMLRVVKSTSYGCSVLVCNSGLYPLVSIMIKNTANLQICYTSLQASSHPIHHQ